MPGAQSCALAPLQLIEQAVVPPHWTVQLVAPWHSAVQPPFGQSIVQVLSPWHVMVDPMSSATWQLLPPAHVTWLFVPAESVQLLVPAQLDVQFDPQLPAQVD
jgi:hypothetical protein